MKRFSNDASKARMLTLRAKRKTVSESVNEQMERRTRRIGEDGYSGYEDEAVSGAVEDYDVIGSHSTPSATASPAPLRRRGPLDTSLSSGRYATTRAAHTAGSTTTAQAVRRVNDTMDDIFGALDMGDMDAEGQEELTLDSEINAEERGSATRRSAARRRAKDLSEDEYIAWLETKQKRARAARWGGGALEQEEEEDELQDDEAYAEDDYSAKGSRKGAQGRIAAHRECTTTNSTRQAREDGKAAASRAKRSASKAIERPRREGSAMQESDTDPEHSAQSEEEAREETGEDSASDAVPGDSNSSSTTSEGAEGSSVKKMSAYDAAAAAVCLTVEEQEEGDIVQQLCELRHRLTDDGKPSSAATAASASIKSPSSTAEAVAADGDGDGTNAHPGDAARDAVRHFHLLYGQLLRLRVKLQPIVVKALCLPQYYALPHFVRTSAEVRQRCESATTALTETLRDLIQCAQSSSATTRMNAMSGKANAFLAHGGSNDDGEDGSNSADESARKSGTTRKRQANEGRGKHGVGRSDYDAITQFHTTVLQSAKVCLGHWGSRAVQANGVKLKAIAQPLPQQIESILLSSRSRLRAKVQRNRSHLRILAHPEHLAVVESVAAAVPPSRANGHSDKNDDDDNNGRKESDDDAAARLERIAEARARRAAHIADGDVDEEIFDDSDFLRELVHRGGTAAARLERQLREMQTALQLPSSKPSRVGMHRQTKGKTVSYETIPKLVGFTVASGFENSGRKETVVGSLFQ